MSHQDDFARLEAIVEKLLNTVDALRREKTGLQDALHQKEEELRAVQEQSVGLNEERDEILARVNKLIGSIEEWENSESQDGATGKGGEESLSGFSVQAE